MLLNSQKFLLDEEKLFKKWKDAGFKAKNEVLLYHVHCSQDAGHKGSAK